MTQDSQPRHGRAVQPRRGVRTAIAVYIILIVAAGLVLLGWTVLRLLQPVSRNPNAPMILVSIPKGAESARIGSILHSRHLVHSARAFTLAARLRGVDQTLKSGRYELSPAMAAGQIAEIIAAGATAEDVLTIPEGFTADQIAGRLAQHNMGTTEDIRALMRTGGRSFTVDGWTPPAANLEGFLFPDTYRFAKGTNARDAITELLHAFVSHTQPAGLLALPPKKVYDIVTLASLVEREAEVDRDRPLIAGALSNRLRIHMPLDCDASIQYALPQHRTRLFYRDLKVDSPYNTYRHAGLPPTPIANPGIASITAAMHPAPVPYLYYVAKPDGSHVFSTTLQEHDRAIAQIRHAAQ